jgi:predicted ATP-grasp superfamily ATP-dependent carboligase
MTDVTLSEVLENREYLKDCFRAPFAPYERYIAASDKVNLFLIARDLNLPMPKTLFSSDYNDSRALLRDARAFGFPVVVKPARSRFRIKDSWLNARVRYAENEHALRTLLDEEPFKSFPYIVQERVIGPGVGIFLLIHNGEVLATFAHRRIREKPPSGGVSVVCESVEAPPEALNSAVRLLEKLNWSGVAMVEYKWDVADNLPKLMEINARFWGSLQLAVSAGVDFPYLFFRLANGEKTNPVTTYKIGIKSRWELGDLDHLLIRMRKESAQLALPPGAASKWRVFTSFLGDFFKPSVRHEVLRPDDPEPFLCELKQYLKELRNSIPKSILPSVTFPDRIQ